MKQKKHNTGKWRWVAAGMGLLMAACSKDDTQPADIYTKNGIAAVVNNNFSLQLFNYALTITGYDDTLSQRGPFTLIGPSNDAFKAAGFGSGAVVIRAADSMRAWVPYCIVRGQVRMDSLPLAFNQVLMAINGQPLYVTHWRNSRDTAMVINGSRVSTLDKPATNGLLNIADAVLTPIVYNNVQQAVSGDPALSLFNAAIIRSGMAETLQQADLYTVFAPTNTAFAAIGITTTDSIYKMDPAVLQSLVKGHIITGRNFVYDYILKADVATNTYNETMLNGSAAIIALVPNSTQPGRFSSITIQQGAGQTATLSSSNVLAGNGVVHSISTILTP